MLTQLLGLTYAEAAAVCGCPVGTIRSRVARARETLVAGLQEEVARVASRAFVAIAVAVVWLVAGSDPAAAAQRLRAWAPPTTRRASRTSAPPCRA